METSVIKCPDKEKLRMRKILPRPMHRKTIVAYNNVGMVWSLIVRNASAFMPQEKFWLNCTQLYQNILKATFSNHMVFRTAARALSR
ncbi:hypothetical protein TNIN_218531 [Trichonephila inaurata madagascariensis]|uniref:Uncharacterized protein n=1 Tax=Trichonephila inaurata madagascariensis TaxID=2747483 RepID=A0A8X6WWQ5_9ARAC|nr:hypothetical protein TNIN_22491 [Trichonephila inaurata madagascariensis]GFY78084.1 hypothetical protein TNIN_218531 [Trichonephila inaurata madagascariensis]